MAGGALCFRQFRLAALSLLLVCVPYSDGNAETADDLMEITEAAPLRTQPSSRGPTILVLQPPERVTRTALRMRDGYVQVHVRDRLEKGWVSASKLRRVSGAFDRPAARSSAPIPPTAIPEANSSLPEASEVRFNQGLAAMESAKTDLEFSYGGDRWALRSQHFVFEMPRLTDGRHMFTPDGGEVQVPGISVIVREGFVVGHFDSMKAPLWVAQRWTKFDHRRMTEIPSQGRPWQIDLETPSYADGGTSYQGNKTMLDRGHMARHAMNRAWGADSSNWGSKMSNSAPQHKRINRFSSAWQELEDEIMDTVAGPESRITAVWTISGAIYRDQENPAGESPEDDFGEVVRLRKGGFGIPDATYKIVGWFDDNGRFQARAYVFEQPHSEREEGGEQVLSYDLGDPKAPLTDFLVTIDSIEARTGVDFFPALRQDIQELVEGSLPQSLWGDE